MDKKEHKNLNRENECNLRINPYCWKVQGATTVNIQHNKDRHSCQPMKPKAQERRLKFLKATMLKVNNTSPRIDISMKNGKI